MDTMRVSFPGGKRVDAEYGGHTIRTDQPPQGGGEGSAPALNAQQFTASRRSRAAGI